MPSRPERPNAYEWCEQRGCTGAHARVWYCQEHGRYEYSDGSAVTRPEDGMYDSLVPHAMPFISCSDYTPREPARLVWVGTDADGHWDVVSPLTGNGCMVGSTYESLTGTSLYARVAEVMGVSRTTARRRVIAATEARREERVADEVPMEPSTPRLEWWWGGGGDSAHWDVLRVNPSTGRPETVCMVPDDDTRDNPLRGPALVSRIADAMSVEYEDALGRLGRAAAAYGDVAETQHREDRADMLAVVRAERYGSGGSFVPPVVRATEYVPYRTPVSTPNAMRVSMGLEPAATRPDAFRQCDSFACRGRAEHEQLWFCTQHDHYENVYGDPRDYSGHDLPEIRCEDYSIGVSPGQDRCTSEAEGGRVSTTRPDTPEEPMPGVTHTQTIRHSVSGLSHFFTCSCGTRGRRQDTETSAQRLADTHARRAHGVSSTRRASWFRQGVNAFDRCSEATETCTHPPIWFCQDRSHDYSRYEYADGTPTDEAAEPLHVPHGMPVLFDHGNPATSPRTRAARQTAAPAERTFGVEIEFIGSLEGVAAAVRAAGLPCSYAGYSHAVSHTDWKVVTDGSVSRGGELVSPVLAGEDGRRQIRTACEALRTAGATVNRSTGLHVHHDVRDLDVRAFGRVFRAWYNGQSAIDTMVSRSRREGRNSYCTPLTEREISQVESLLTVDRASTRRLGDTRYRTLNVQSYGKYGTVEVRQHQGTINAAKILAWIDFGQSLIAWARTARPMFDRGAQLPTLLAETREAGLSEESATYLATRSVELATDAMANA